MANAFWACWPAAFGFVVIINWPSDNFDREGCAKEFNVIVASLEFLERVDEHLHVILLETPVGNLQGGGDQFGAYDA